MIVDLHAHYPMHLDPGVRGNLWYLITRRAGRLRLRDHARAVLVNFASQFANYPSFGSRPRVTVDKLVSGHVGVAYSVLYSFFDEADPSQPEPTEYVDELLRLIELVEKRSGQSGRAVVAKRPSELSPADGQVVLVHCVEGGFHLVGGEVADAVRRLAHAGVAYITLAHLIYRGIATGANAFPFISDATYERKCRQPTDKGLSERGVTAVEAMLEHKVLIDVAHMNDLALRDTFALLDHHDPDKRIPVLATHGGYRFGDQSYNLGPDTLTAIKDRNGVIGLIFAQHQIWDGLHDPRFPKIARWHETWEDSFAKLSRHIDAIAEHTGGFDHIGIGSDLDGFIKPTLKGLRDMKDMRRLELALIERYGEQRARLMCSENALRPLKTYWKGGPR